MPDFSFPISMLTKVIAEVYAHVSGPIKAKIATLKAAGKVSALHKRLWQIQKVKTIWNPDRPISLSTIFYPVTVQHEVDGRQVTRQVNSISDLHYDHCIILGTAGQGKSILMKYLVGKEIRSGERVPLLYELRNYSEGSFEQCLSERFSGLLGITPDDGVFRSFAERGGVSFLLDGFDEVDSSLVPLVLQGIEDISYKYPLAKIILTSRPDSECVALTQFNSIKLMHLQADNLLDFFKKITKDSDFSNRLNDSISKSSVGIRGIITTPLAATLLAIVYRSSGKIPDEFSEFFEELFQVLLLRHDSSKLGWRRQRASALTDRQLQIFFEAFCFQVRRRRSLSVERDEAQSVAQEALDFVSAKADPNACLKDLKKVTCLIVEEGRRLEFVHASVANFFAARFVKNLPEDQAKRFYDQLLESHWSTWISEIGFLRQIDGHRLRTNFLIEDISSAINLLSIDNSAVELIDYYMKNSVLIKRQLPGGRVRYFTDKLPAPKSYSLRDVGQIIFNVVFSNAIVGCRDWHEVVSSMGNEDVMPWKEVASRRGSAVMSLAQAELAKKCEALRQELDEVTGAVNKVSSVSPLLKL